MMELLQSFDLKAWLLTGGLSLLLTSTITIMVMLIKQKIKDASDITQRKILNESTMSTLVGLGTDIKTLLTNIGAISESITPLIEIVQTASNTIQMNSTNVASFVLECFTESNLSDEKKAKLKTLFEKTFFTNYEQFIENLKTAKDNSDNALVEANKIIETLRATIVQKDAQLLTHQTTAKARRI
jgi:hypothetical protein